MTPAPFAPSRPQLREKFSIDGSGCQDCLVAWFCLCCARQQRSGRHAIVPPRRCGCSRSFLRPSSREILARTGEFPDKMISGIHGILSILPNQFFNSLVFDSHQGWFDAWAAFGPRKRTVENGALKPCKRLEAFKVASNVKEKIA